MIDKCKLFCFPFSGGSSSFYSTWFKNIPPHIELYPVELAGRNKRFSEPLMDSIDETVQDLFKNLSSELYSPYIFFGHSLGCLIIYELMQLLNEKKFSPPEHIFLSGACPPHFIKNQDPIHTLSDQRFFDEIIKMGGISQEFIKNRELQQIYLPVIRSDYRMYEKYKPKDSKFILPCNVTALVGSRDDVSNAEIAQNWSHYTNHHFELHVYEGDHFFLKHHAQKILSLIEQVTLKKICLDYTS